jgi:hypothetical protein
MIVPTFIIFALCRLELFGISELDENFTVEVDCVPQALVAVEVVVEGVTDVLVGIV